ncbi:hypothetical protein [Cohnella fermenti]|uniref:Uncharacterized protein n=1 Tax=Cohnella fermenti TaxID=2565925 RepID=A0A4S4BRF4_9BACL|nr:hypothetical protein [Cohnella fermenti]THF77589.1 hypothetical protein E6C55_16365 [Cohnella fermenti]
MPRERSNAVSGTNAPFVGAKPSKKPIIGSHRAKSPMIGGHREQEELQWNAAQGPRQDPRKPTGGIGIGSHRSGFAVGGKRFEMVSNREEKMDKRLLPKGKLLGVELNSKTLYANDKERAGYERTFNGGGKMMNRSDGKTTDTIGALQSATKGAKADRHIFTMDQKGKFYSTDSVKENLARSKQIHDQRKQDLKDLQNDPEKREKLRNMQLPHMKRIHHSTFGAGADVAGAGELQVRDGQVELVSDASGHYKPGAKQMIQTVQQLGRNNVPLEQLGVEFIGKPEFEYETDYSTGKTLIDKATGKKVIKRDADDNLVVKKDRDGLQSNTNNIQASALELLSYANYAPDAAEERIRDMHGKKNDVLSHLLLKTKRIEPIAYDYAKEMQANQPRLMSEPNKEKPQVEVVPAQEEEQYFGTVPLEGEADGEASDDYDSDSDYNYNYNYNYKYREDENEKRVSYKTGNSPQGEESLSYNSSTLLKYGDTIPDDSDNSFEDEVPFSYNSSTLLKYGDTIPDDSNNSFEEEVPFSYNSSTLLKYGDTIPYKSGNSAVKAVNEEPFSYNSSTLFNYGDTIPYKSGTSNSAEKKSKKSKKAKKVKKKTEIKSLGYQSAEQPKFNYNTGNYKASTGNYNTGNYKSGTGNYNNNDDFDDSDDLSSYWGD